jgi:phage major head subunit gpT-like protein
MIINLSNLDSLFVSYNAAFAAGFGSAEPQSGAIATEVGSTSGSNIYPFLGHFPQLRKWVGDRVAKNLVAHSYSIVNDPYEATVEVPRPTIEDDEYGVFSPMMAEMGYSVAMHPDELIFALAALGATELCYDGQPFFNASHPIVVDGVTTTASNYDATGGGALWMVLDISRPLKPFVFQKRKDYDFQQFTKPSDEHVFMTNKFLYGVDARVNVGFGLWQLAYGSLNTLNGTNFDAIVTAMEARKSDEGKPLGIKAKLIVCGPTNRAAARNLVDLAALANGADNPNYKEVDYLVTPYLT